MKTLFFLNCMLVVGMANSQNVGINYATPQYPLSFNGNLGNKISLWTDGTATHYGMGVQSALFQIFSKTAGDDIAFGYGSSTAFTEMMRIKGSGNIGIATTSPTAKLSIGTVGTELAGAAMSNAFKINAGSLGSVTASEINLASIGFKASGNNTALGVRAYRNNTGTDWTTTSILLGYDVDNTPRPAGGGNGYLAFNALGNIGIGVVNPQYTLDINGRMRLGGTNPNDPGIWLMEGVNNRAFVGLKDNNYVGFYAAGGAGWGGLTMNVNSGALALNGNEGQNGQLLTSNSSAAGASWTNRPYVTYFNEAGLPSLQGNDLCADIGGVNAQTLVLTQDANISYQFNTTLYADNGAFGGTSMGAVSIQFLNPGSVVVSAGTSQYVIDNYRSSTIVVNGIGILPAGNYTIRARLVRSGTADGVTRTNGGSVGNTANCNDVSIVNGQMIVQVFPR